MAHGTSMTSANAVPNSAGLTALDPRRLELVLRRCEADRRSRMARAPESNASIGTYEVPLSLGQERLWLAEQLAPGNTSYNITLPLRIHGPLDIPALSSALDQVVVRHEALRTTIGSRSGLPFGRIHPAHPGVLRVLDLRGLDEKQRDDSVRQRIAENISTPFDLEQGPLFRAQLLRIAAPEAILLLTAHHITADNFSIRVFCRDLAFFYAGTQGTEELGAPLPYSVFAARQRVELAGDLDRQAQYWLRELEELPDSLALPSDYPRPAERSFRGAQVPFRVPISARVGFKQLQTRHGVTPFMIMLAALTLLLQRYTGQDDLAVGTDVANRTSADTEDVIGFFANQLVLRVRVDDHITVAELLQRTRTVCLGAYEHQDFPFQQLVSMLGRDRDSTQPPLFQVKLGYLQFSPEQLDLPGCTVTLIPTEGTAKFDIEVTSWPTADGLVAGFLEYATDLFAPETMRRMSDHLAEAVAAMAVDDTAKVLHVPLRGAGGDVIAVNQRDRFDWE
jgi:hypothetical protein